MSTTRSFSVSVVIVTKNRARDLLQCLGFLVAQSISPDEVIIVNNNSTDNTHAVCESFQKNVRFPIRCVLEKGVGYPVVYNRALQEAAHSWVAVLDDDCAADPTWYETIKKSVRMLDHPAVILGQTRPWKPHNIYSLVTYILHTQWKENNCRNNIVVNYEILDNKNIVYNRKFLQKHNLRYDESRVNILQGAGEDADLGLQIQRAGGGAVYNRSILAYHKETQDWAGYLHKFFVSLAAYEFFKSKWESARVRIKKTISLRSLIAQISNEYRYNAREKIHLYVVITFSVLISLLLASFLHFSLFKRYFITIVDTYEKNNRT